MIVRSASQVKIPQVPLHDFLFSSLKEHEDKVALVESVSGQTYTHRQTHDITKQVGSALTRLGIKKGDVVTFYAPNSVNYCLATLGCFTIGATFSGANYSYTPDELQHQLLDSEPKMVVTAAANLPTLNKVLDNNKTSVEHVMTLDEKVPDVKYFGDLLTDDGSAFPKDMSINVFDDVAAIMYSSGTTGLPKGVMLTHFNLVANICMLQIPENIPPLRPGDDLSTLMFLPMFHMFGMILLLHMLSWGGKGVLLAGFKPDVFLQAIQDHKVTAIYVVPPIVIFLSKSPLVDKYDVSSLTAAASAAAPLAKESEKSFLDRFKLERISQGYGMTEMTAYVTGTVYGREKKPGAAGCLAANTIAKIVDLVTGADKGTGEEGELCLQGPQMMKGYLNRPDATAAMFDEDGWLHTGDVGYFDEDGDLFVTGRIKELIKHKGFQVAPAEVEGIILQHPGVLDAAVIGVPDEAAGELPRAFVVKKPDSEVTEEDVYDHVKGRLSRHKWLSGGVEFVKSIPKTASGKIIRSEVKKMLKAKDQKA